MYLYIHINTYIIQNRGKYWERVVVGVSEQNYRMSRAGNALSSRFVKEAVTVRWSFSGERDWLIVKVWVLLMVNITLADLLFKICELFWRSEFQREREIFCLLVYSLDGCHGQRWPWPKLRTSSFSPLCVAVAQVHHGHSQAIGRGTNQCSWDAGITSSDFS